MAGKDKDKLQAEAIENNVDAEKQTGNLGVKTVCMGSLENLWTCTI